MGGEPICSNLDIASSVPHVRGGDSVGEGKPVTPGCTFLIPYACRCEPIDTMDTIFSCSLFM